MVAIPTETVYGLAARIYDPVALQNIFITKKRPFFDPLIIHVCSIDQAKTLVRSWPREAQILAEAFWPGPLTLVLEKTSQVSDLITSGLTTVGIRMPRHELTLKLIEDLGEPVAAPSANIFGRTSPTLARHVRDEFPVGAVSILDGGPCEVGIESTILSLVQGDKSMSGVSGFNLQILRQGMLKESEIQNALESKGLVNSVDFMWRKSGDSAAPQAPGQLKHHYMPTKPLIWVSEPIPLDEILRRVRNSIVDLPRVVEGVQLIKPNKIETAEFLQLSSSVEVAARELYAEMRRAADTPCDILVFLLRPEHAGSEWNPILDRLRKAASLTL